MKAQNRKDYSIETHNQIIGWTSNCDTKASIVLAFIGVLVSITFTSDYLLKSIETQVNNIIVYWRVGTGTFSISATLLFASLICFIILIGLSFFHAISSLKANTKCDNDSIIFFGKIANCTTKEEYIEKVNNITDKDLETDKLSQIFTCATICNKKFELYNKSVMFLYMGLFLFVCFVFFAIISKSL